MVFWQALAVHPTSIATRVPSRHGLEVEYSQEERLKQVEGRLWGFRGSLPKAASGFTQPPMPWTASIGT